MEMEDEPQPDEKKPHLGSSDSDSMTDMEYVSAANARISEEQLRLSYSDRNTILEDIHGVAFNAQNETPDLLQSSLAQLLTELEDLVKFDWKDYATKSTLSAGYLLSLRNGANGAYVNSRDFQLRFLRCEDFNAKKAAIRLMHFMNFVLEVFGAFALFRPIKLTDFKRSEMKVLQSGFLQVLPFRDRSGRKVFIWVGGMGIQYDPILRMKITAYTILAGTRDIESQQKGIVSVILPTETSAPSPSSFSPRDVIRKEKSQLLYTSYCDCNALLAALPIKVCAVHYCILYDKRRFLSPFERIIVKTIMVIVTSLLPRIKLNIGGRGQVREILSGYGIPVNIFPTTESGAVKTTKFKNWLKLQRRIEALQTAQVPIIPHIDCPRLNDVVFRSGSTMIANPGNVMFRDLIELKIRRKMRRTKEEVAIEIMDEILQDRKGRFLVWDNKYNCWVELQDMFEVKSKIATTYRDLKLKLAKSQAPSTYIQQSSN